VVLCQLPEPELYRLWHNIEIDPLYCMLFGPWIGYLTYNIIRSLCNVHKYFIYIMYYNKQHLMYTITIGDREFFYIGRNIYDKKLSLCNAYEKDMVVDCVPDKSSNIFLVNC
jgi:hypothetical protein